MMVTFTPLGVASEYNWKGCFPRGKSLSCVDPAMGRLIFAKTPPLALFQVQTAGGVYGVASDTTNSPGLLWRETTEQFATPQFADAAPLQQAIQPCIYCQWG